MKIFVIAACCIVLVFGAAAAANQDTQKEGLSCAAGAGTDVIRLADWPPGVDACTADSDCGAGHKCCPTKNGRRCFRVATCP